MSDVQEAICALVRGRDLSLGETQDVMRIIMSGDATPAQIGAFLVALHIKGETVDEILGAALIMREFAAAVDAGGLDVVDCVGTGGDGAHLFNVSTASALVTAAAGATVAKHGNRAATGSTGAADVLEAAGVNITLTPEQVGRSIREVGIGFMFAPTHHGATRHAVGPRREIGVRSIFNVLGPLTNPAGARRQLVGVYEARWIRPIAEVFASLGSSHALVVHSTDGLDEISIAAPTSVAELREGQVVEYSIVPEDVGLQRHSLESLTVQSVKDSLAIINNALEGGPGPAADMIALNAGATIYAAGVEPDLPGGVGVAREVLAAGKGAAKLDELARFTRQFAKQ